MRRIFLILLTSSLISSASAQDDLAWLKPYNIVWETPSAKAIHSMPSGAGNVALNVWSTGTELLFYIGSSDSWADGELPGKVQNVKIGRIRLTVSPNPFSKDFRQELDLATNSIRVSGTAGDGTRVNLLLWVDAGEPVIHLEGNSSAPVNTALQVETWRGSPAFSKNSIIWMARNEGPSRARAESIKRQGVEDIAKVIPDPVGNLTFGGIVTGTGMVKDKIVKGIHEGKEFTGLRLKTRKPVTDFNIRATLRISQDPTAGDWERALRDLDFQKSSTIEADRTNTREWWRSFWDRSHIVINPGKPGTDPAWQAGRNYQLFRAMLATNSKGKMPTLFNGGAFICEAEPDKRLWGEAGFTAQNQRLVYWPMLKSGDMDLLRVALDFYAERLPVEKAWARHFWDVDGGVYPEDIDLFGITVRLAREDGTCTPECLRYHWTSGMEFALMMLETWRFNASDIRPYIPVAVNILRFYDQFYRKQNLRNTGSELDENGKLVIYPGSGLELYSEARNDAAALSGLMALSTALAALPSDMLNPDDRIFCKMFRDQLAPLALMTRNGHLCIAPAVSWKAERLDSNMELPQLYPVFPFGLYGIKKAELGLARNTWQYGYTDAAKQKPYFCWYQGGIFAACLGLTEEAKEYALAKFLHPAWPAPGGNERLKETVKTSNWKLHWLATEGWEIPRYPAFWDCMEFDQRPDMDHGGSAMIQLQEMLLQTTGNEIVLFPAWPRDWDVDFKLHAPGSTVVECSYSNGSIVSLKVTPEGRMKDVIVNLK